ncbi:hypothetical protein [Silanimonas sp.]|uniref:hypothetical protein n=1 Tax=Silanimonas sp. TaxID=1929290 RepID=UPI0037CBC287
MPTATVPRLPLASLMGFAASFAIASLSSPATAMTPTLNARVALVADHAAVAPGQSFKAGLRIVHDKGWHTYWANPGDSGLPTRFEPPRLSRRLQPLRGWSHEAEEVSP